MTKLNRRQTDPNYKPSKRYLDRLPALPIIDGMKCHDPGCIEGLVDKTEVVIVNYQGHSYLYHDKHRPTLKKGAYCIKYRLHDMKRHSDKDILKGYGIE